MYDSTKVCRKCGLEKSIDEFYKRSGANGTQSYCIACYNARAATQIRAPKNIAGEQSERDVVSVLLSNGIYATGGKASAFKYIDVVAWGCVRIEVKSSTLRSNNYPDDLAYTFGFTANQQKRGIDADLVVLVCLGKTNTQNTYHIFPSNHPVFYKYGRLKSAVVYSTIKKRPYMRVRGGIAMSHTLMHQHQDAWHLIEEKRFEISQRLRSGEVWPG